MSKYLKTILFFLILTISTNLCFSQETTVGISSGTAAGSEEETSNLSEACDENVYNRQLDNRTDTKDALKSMNADIISAVNETMADVGCMEETWNSTGAPIYDKDQNELDLSEIIDASSDSDTDLYCENGDSYREKEYGRPPNIQKSINSITPPQAYGVGSDNKDGKQNLYCSRCQDCEQCSDDSTDAFCTTCKTCSECAPDKKTLAKNKQLKGTPKTTCKVCVACKECDDKDPNSKDCLECLSCQDCSDRPSTGISISGQGSSPESSDDKDKKFKTIYKDLYRPLY